MDFVGAVASWFADPSHWVGPNGVPYRLAQHVGISLASVGIAGAIALPLGLYVGHTGRGQSIAVNLPNGALFPISLNEYINPFIVDARGRQHAQFNAGASHAV